MDINDRLPPHSIEAEMATLAAMMLSADVARQVVGRLQSSDFYLTDHRIIYQALDAMIAAGRPVDGVSLKNELARRNVLDDIGGSAYLGQVLGSVPAASHGEEYARIVAAHSHARRLIAASDKAIAAAYAGGDADAIGDKLIEDALAAKTGSAEIIHLGEAAADVARRIDEGGTRYIQTGMSEWDDRIGGIPAGGFTIVAGRPGMGKSVMMRMLAWNMAQMPVPVGIISVEEDRSKIAENLLSSYTRIENRKIVRNDLGDGDKQIVRDASDDMGRMPLWIVDSEFTLRGIQARCAELVSRHKCRVILVDHIHQIDAGQRDEVREITLISRGLKHTARQLGIGLVAAAQLNRGGEVGETPEPPQLRNLRSSGALEQDGDIIVMLHRRDYYDAAKPHFVPSNTIGLHVRKHKWGPMPEFEVFCDMSTQTIGGVNAPLL